MSTSGSHTRPSDTDGRSGTDFIGPEEARQILFEKILDQLADSSLFSSGTSPTIFIVYAHDNEKEGAAYDECVRKLISWLERVHAQILSDHSPLPPFVSKFEGTDAVGNILSNQMCLLPPSCYGPETPKTICVDKVIVCGSQVMENYSRRPSAQAYIEEIVQICSKSAEQPIQATLESQIRGRVENECGRDDFHHVITELAFLEFRKSSLPETDDMVPIVLNQHNPDDAPMRYLSVFYNTDVKLKLKSLAASSLHKLFFKLLKRLFPDNRDFIKSFEQCYRASEDVELRSGERVIREEFASIVNRRITEAYQEYWKLSCVLVRDGKLRAYTGKLGDQISQVLENVNQSMQREILKWLSPISASELHGKYHDSGTSRLQGTCDWVIQDEQFRRWYTCEASALLLLRGEMGTGKTYSTSRVIDWVKQGLSTSNNDEAFAYFYCNKQDPSRSEPKEILRSLIRQLATGPWNESANNTAVHKKVHELWEKSQSQGISSIFSEWEACLRALIATYPRTTIVLDALDECNDIKRQDLINLLVNLATRDSEVQPVKIFVAARPEGDVRQHLEKYYLIRMQEEHNAEDIACFVRAKVAEHRRWSRFSQEYQNEMVDKLLEKSGNMFLFASLQMQQLRDCNTQTALRDRLSKLPDSLSNAYEEIYHRATSDPNERKFLERALRWVLCSARPLTTDELLLAVSQDPESGRIEPQNQDLDEEVMLIWTQNLLNLEVNLEGKSSYRSVEALPVWRLAHQAVGEFLEQSARCNSSLAHCESAKVCLMILLDTFGGDTSETTSSTESEYEYDEDFQCPCRKPISSVRHRELPGLLVEYAVHGWLTHVRAQEDGVKRRNDGLSQTLRKFLGQPERGSPAYKTWFEHALHDKTEDDFPEWSIFNSRWATYIRRFDSILVAPLTLACHLGIYNCLLDWWDSSSVDYERVYQLPREWTPEMVWGMWDDIRWSLLALACVHKETNIIKHLLGKKVRVNTTGEDDVPPIVAAARAGSVKTVGDLIKCGADICSPFTTRHGHLLGFAIRSNSLSVMRLLLQQPGLSQVSEVEEALRSTEWSDIRSAAAIEIIIGTGINVNTPLDDGSLLFAAAERGWENMVYVLLGRGANPNVKQYKWLDYNSVLDAYISHDSPSPSTVTQLIKCGAHVTSQDVAKAESQVRPGEHEWRKRPSSHEVETRKEILQLLLGCKPDMNETWEDMDGHNTSVLIEAVENRDMELVHFSVRHGANVNLRVGGWNGDALNCAFRATLDRPLWHQPTPTHYAESAREMIDVLVEEGASLDSLEGESLHTALAAAAFAGSEDLVQDLLNRGASPYAFCSHEYQTALGAAAASENRWAPDIVHTLLNNDPDTSKDNDFFKASRMALYEPFYKLFLGDGYEISCLGADWRYEASWLGSASVLARHHAVWDIDSEQWFEGLKKSNPDIWKEDAELLAELQQMLEGNRTDFFLKFPEAASCEEWRIKDAKDARSDGCTLLPVQEQILHMISIYL